MSLDTGNRSFVLLLAVASAVYLILSAAACAVLALLAYAGAGDGRRLRRSMGSRRVAGLALGARLKTDTTLP